jgi:hypothetical protein
MQQYPTWCSNGPNMLDTTMLVQHVASVKQALIRYGIKFWYGTDKTAVQYSVLNLSALGSPSYTDKMVRLSTRTNSRA